MLTSRNLADLLPPVEVRARALVARCAVEGIDLLVTCTYRDDAAQAALYAQGRTKPGRKVTNAKPGQSYHQHRVAFDVVPLRDGKPVWDASDPVWRRVGELGEDLGLEWAGRWTRFREYPHFQYTQGFSLAEFQNGTAQVT